MRDFTEKELVSFGNYLLSKRRKEIFINNPGFPDGALLEERMSEVNHSDIYNWMEEERHKEELLWEEELRRSEIQDDDKFDNY